MIIHSFNQRHSNFNLRPQFTALRLSSKKDTILSNETNNNIYKMMRTIKRFLWKMDFFSAPIVLRSKQQTNVSSTGLGIFSFLLIGLFTYVLIADLILIFEMDNDKIQSSQSLHRSPNPKKAEEIMFAISYQSLFLGVQEYSQYFSMEAVLWNFNTTKRYTMVPCQPEHWQLLGDDYETKFADYYLQLFYCLPEVLSGMTEGFENPFLTVELAMCNHSQICAPKENISLLYEQVLARDRKFSIYTMMLNTYAQVGDPEGLKYGVEYRTFTTSSKQGLKVFMQFDIIKIKTDYSVWPVIESIEEVEGITISEIFHAREDFLNVTDYNLIFKAALSFTEDLIFYDRKITKLDDSLSYVGGLLGIIAFILMFILRSFNEYRYELHVAENTFNYDSDGYKVSEDNLTFFMYIKFRVYSWIYTLFCHKKLEWKDCREMQQTLMEARQVMNVDNLYRRISIMEKVIWETYDPNILMVSTLMEPGSIDDVKNKRLTLEYYKRIIKREGAPTVEDAINETPQSFVYLEKAQNKVEKLLTYSPARSMRAITSLGEIIEQSPHLDSYQQSYMLKDELMKYLNLQDHPQICEKISLYEIIDKEAQLFKFKEDEQEDFQKVEQEITQAFIDLEKDIKPKLILKIPLIIIFRMKIVAKALSLKPSPPSKNGSKEEKKKENMEEEEEKEAKIESRGASISISSSIDNGQTNPLLLLKLPGLSGLEQIRPEIPSKDEKAQ